MATRAEPSNSSEATHPPRRRVLVFSTRGIGTQARHLMEDIRALLPHSKREQKLDAKDRLDTANEIAELHGCQACVLFEARKRQDLYLWTALTPGGPTVRWEVQNVHTMSELRLTGNALRGARPILVFDREFDDSAMPHRQLMKELLTQVFTVPRGDRRSRPFVDRVMGFFMAGDAERVWVRNYQIVPDKLAKAAQRWRVHGRPRTDESSPAEPAGADEEEMSAALSEALVEIGPRLVLTPIRLFAGSFGGKTLWENHQYISPNELRRMTRLRHDRGVLEERSRKKARRQAQLAEALAAAPQDELADVFRGTAEELQ